MTLRVYALGLMVAGCTGFSRMFEYPGPAGFSAVAVRDERSALITMVTAWFIPKNPLTDPSLDKSTAGMKKL